MDQLPRVPAYSCLSAVQVIHLSNNCGWKLLWNCILFGWHLTYPLLSGSCAVVICWDDNSSPYCSFYSAIICTSASLVCHTSISRGYGEVIRISSGSCNGAWLGSAGTNSSYFLSYCILTEGHTFLMFNSCPIPDWNLYVLVSRNKSTHCSGSSKCYSESDWSPLRGDLRFILSPSYRVLY